MNQNPKKIWRALDMRNLLLARVVLLPVAMARWDGRGEVSGIQEQERGAGGLASSHTTRQQYEGD